MSIPRGHDNRAVKPSSSTIALNPGYVSKRFEKYAIEYESSWHREGFRVSEILNLSKSERDSELILPLYSPLLNFKLIPNF